MVYHPGYGQTASGMTGDVAVVRLAQEGVDQQTRGLKKNIRRDGQVGFQGETSTSQIHRPLGELIEYDDTRAVFTKPSKKQTEDYVTGRFG